MRDSFDVFMKPLKEVSTEVAAAAASTANQSCRRTKGRGKGKGKGQPKPLTNEDDRSSVNLSSLSKAFAFQILALK